jgi:hypothetical protein
MSEETKSQMNFYKDGKSEPYLTLTDEGYLWPIGTTAPSVKLSVDQGANTYASEEIRFYEPPKYVGGYRLGGDTTTQFNVTKKPFWFHRTMVKLVLGWEWVDL